MKGDFMKISKKVMTILSVFAVTAVGLMFSEAALAASTLQQQVATFNSGFGDLSTLVTKGMFLAGIASGGMAALKFKEHSDNPQQVKLSKPLIYLLASGMLVGLPAMLDMSATTLTGQGATTTFTQM